MSNRSMESESEGLTGLMEISAHNVECLLLFDTFIQLHVGGNLKRTNAFYQIELLQCSISDDSDL